MYTIYKCVISWSLTVFKISKSQDFFGAQDIERTTRNDFFENIFKKKLRVLSVFIVPKIVISILPFLRNSADKKRENTNKKKRNKIQSGYEKQEGFSSVF